MLGISFFREANLNRREFLIGASAAHPKSRVVQGASHWPQVDENGAVRLSDFGAVGNGLRDDTEAFHEALDFLITYGGVLMVAPGRYKISRGYTNTQECKQPMISIKGSGKHSSHFIFDPDDETDFFSINMMIGGRSGTISVRDVGISLVKDAAGGVVPRNGIYMTNASRSEVTACYIYGFRNGAGLKIDASNEVGCDFNEIVSTYIGDCRTGIEIDCSSDCGAYNSATFVSRCQLVNNACCDFWIRRSGSRGSNNAHFIDNCWIQTSESAVGLAFSDDVNSCKISNLAIDGVDTTKTVGMLIGEHSANHAFSNVSIDGKLIDRSKQSKFSNFRASGVWIGSTTK